MIFCQLSTAFDINKLIGKIDTSFAKMVLLGKDFWTQELYAKLNGSG